MRRTRLSLALVALACLAGLGGTPATAGAKTKWLCKPGLADNPCLDSLTTTVVAPDGSTRVERTRRARRPKIDCFFVYPTVSGQPGITATRAIDPEIRAIASVQAARFSSICRPFAPVYRQFTIVGIATPDAFTPSAVRRVFGDVTAAWNEYLRKYNKGRGVVLIGHSQGTYMLRELARRLIDKRPRVRRRLVSALLIGGNVSVRKGSDRGGDFDHIPACRRARQLGCVIAYSTYFGTPPADTRFGVAETPFFGGEDLSKLEALCTNPAALSGDRGALRSYFPTKVFPGPIGVVQPQPPAGIPTPWAATPRLYSGRCVSKGKADWLRVRDVGAAGDSRFRVSETIGRAWGLHLVDMHLAFGNLVSIVERQARAYLARD